MERATTSDGHPFGNVSDQSNRCVRKLWTVASNGTEVHWPLRFSILGLRSFRNAERSPLRDSAVRLASNRNSSSRLCINAKRVFALSHVTASTDV